MDRKKFHKVALHDSYAAGTLVVTSGNYTTISGLPQIVAPDMKVKRVTEVTGNAETTQALTVKLNGTWAASTRYSLSFKYADERWDSQTTEPQIFATKTDTASSGSSATDKHNLYARLVSAFNRNIRFSRYSVGYAIFTLTWTAQATAFSAGSIVVGATSGARGLIVSQTAAGATGTFTLAVIDGYSSNFTVETVTEILSTGAAGTGSRTAGTLALGVEMRFNDRAGYYPVNGFRGGALMCLPTDGFVKTDVVVTTAAVYAKFTGSVLNTMLPVKQWSSENLNSGLIDYANMNNAPTSGNTYNLIIIEIERNVGGVDGIKETAGISGSTNQVYGLYLNAADGDYAASLAAVQALVS